jgi:hypothetical protein
VVFFAVTIFLTNFPRCTIGHVYDSVHELAVPWSIDPATLEALQLEDQSSPALSLDSIAPRLLSWLTTQDRPVGYNEEPLCVSIGDDTLLLHNELRLGRQYLQLLDNVLGALPAEYAEAAVALAKEIDVPVPTAVLAATPLRVPVPPLSASNAAIAATREVGEGDGEEESELQAEQLEVGEIC